MLTYWDIQVFGYYEEWGEPYCVPCAVKKFNAVLVEKCRMGLDDTLHPLSRFELVESAVERGYAAMEDRFERFKAEHPILGSWPALSDPSLLRDDPDWPMTHGEHRFLLRGYEYENCCECGVRITPPKFEKAPVEA